MEKYTTQDAIAKLGATPHKNGYIYHARETDEWVVVSEKDLGDLVRLMNSDDLQESRDAYSHWSCGVGQVVEAP